MTTFVLFVAFTLLTGAAVFVFVCNAYTPLQFGPIPFFGTAILGGVFLIAFIARLVTGG